MTKWIAPALSAVLLVACSPATGESPTPTPQPTRSVSPMPTPQQPETPTESPSPTAEPSPAFSQSYPPPDPDETEEQRAIREGWEAYRSVTDRYVKDPTITDWDLLREVATGNELDQLIESITSLRERDLKAEGHTVFRNVMVGEPAATADGGTIATVTSCLDPSSQYLVHLDTGERSDVGLTETLREIVTLELGDDAKWRAAEYENVVEEC